MSDDFSLTLQFRTIDNLFNDLFSDLSEKDEFLKKYEDLKQHFILLPNEKKGTYTGFCLLAGELAEYLMISDFFKKKKISFILNWQKTSFQANKDDFFLENSHKRVIPKFSSTKKAAFHSRNIDTRNYPLTVQYHLSSLMNIYMCEYNAMIKNKKDLDFKIQQANNLLSQRTSIIKIIIQNKIKISNRKEIDQAERRNIRIISDLMYLIDTMNRDLKKNYKQQKMEINQT